MPDVADPAGEERRCVRALVTGRVQGVGFRYATQREALRLGLVGWARNRADGRVEVLACGGSDAIDRLVGFLAIGPRYASVTGLDVSAASDHDDLAGFSVG